MASAARSCRRTLLVKAHPRFWAVADPLQLLNGCGFFCLYFCRMCSKDNMGKVSRYISVGRRKSNRNIPNVISSAAQCLIVMLCSV